MKAMFEKLGIVFAIFTAWIFQMRRSRAVNLFHFTVSLAVAIVVGIAITGCGFTSATNNPGNSQPILVALITAPPATLQTSATVKIAATVSNDLTKAGVSWSCAPSNSCGSFSPADTASSATTNYTAPASVPQGGSVTITATSVADNTKDASSKLLVKAAPAVAVTLGTPPPASLPTSATAVIAATVSNDSAKAGVSWGCAPASSCGSFSPTQTASAAPTTYTAPASVPQGENVTITATSVADNTKSATATSAISVLGSAASLKGQYAFLVSGQDNQSGSYAVDGSMTLDGNGNVTGGEQDFEDFNSVDSADPVTGTYTIGPNRRGTITLTVRNDKSVGLNGVETFSIIVTSDSHALINEDDGFATGAGVLDLQQGTPNFTASEVSGGYSFTLMGTDLATLSGVTVSGGTFTADGVSTLDKGTFDTNDRGTIASSAFTGTFGPPDNYGRGLITGSNGTAFTYYIVMGEVLRLIETDNNFGSAGTAYGQGTGSNFSNSSLADKFVFSEAGESTFGPLAAAGELGTDGQGNITAGVADVNTRGAVVTGPLAGGTYAINNGPRGALMIPIGPGSANSTSFIVYLTDPNLNLLDPNNTSGGGGALILDNGADTYGIGVLIPQVSPASSKFEGNYGIELTDAPNGQAETDLTGQILGDASGKLSGTVDYANVSNSSATLSTTNVSASGGFSTDSDNPGRFTGMMLLKGGVFSFVPGTNVQSLSFYQASDSQVFVVETDSNVTTGVLMHQN